MEVTLRVTSCSKGLSSSRGIAVLIYWTNESLLTHSFNE